MLLFMNMPSLHIMVSLFFMTQFNYFFLASTCHRKALNSKFNSLYEICLSLFYCDKRLSSKGSMKCVRAASNPLWNPIFACKDWWKKISVLQHFLMDIVFIDQPTYQYLLNSEKLLKNLSLLNLLIFITSNLEDDLIMYIMKAAHWSYPTLY